MKIVIQFFTSDTFGTPAVPKKRIRYKVLFRPQMKKKLQMKKKIQMKKKTNEEKNTNEEKITRKNHK